MSETTSLLTRAVRQHTAATEPLTHYGAPLIDLAMRVWIGLVFFRSGLQKLDDWESTLFLFEYEYMVPLLPHTAAAYAATAFELAMPVFLFIGLAARLAAVPLLGMAMVIQFALGASNAAYNDFNHFAWMIFLLAIIVRGPGLLSADHFIRKAMAPKAD
jgi:putative oxidoreductase